MGVGKYISREKLKNGRKAYCKEKRRQYTTLSEADREGESKETMHLKWFKQKTVHYKVNGVGKKRFNKSDYIQNCKIKITTSFSEVNLLSGNFLLPDVALQETWEVLCLMHTPEMTVYQSLWETTQGRKPSVL